MVSTFVRYFYRHIREKVRSIVPLRIHFICMHLKRRCRGV